MSSPVSAETLLANYLRGFFWADDEWLEVNGSEATYWQARLAQTTSVEVLPDGRVKWRVRTLIVEHVSSGTLASHICLALNRHAVGWSFAYNPVDHTIHALVAICAPPHWDTFILRLSEKAKLSAWMSDVIAERLASVVGGVPAYGHPPRRSAPRQSFDATYYLLETIRGRPEWILDLTKYQLPSVEDAASTIAEIVDVPRAQVWCDRNQMRLPIGTFNGRDVHMNAGYARHPIAGECWQSSLKLGADRISDPLAEQLSAMTWHLFVDSETNLLGGWSYEAGHLVYQQWNTMSEVRCQEQLGSYDGRSAADLWGFTSTLSDVLGEIARVPLRWEPQGGLLNDSSQRAEWVIASIAEQARPALAGRQKTEDEPADRRLLWMERRQTVSVAIWFNPMGPTVTSMEVCALPDGAEYLMYYRRHPSAPYYCVLGPVSDGPQLALYQEDGTKLLVDGTLPNVLVQWNNPTATAEEVPQVLRNRVIEVAQQSGTDLAAEAAWIAETIGQPWKFVDLDTTERDRVRAAAAEAAAARPAPDHGFAQWWEQASSFDNSVANFKELPDAWDGSLNVLKGNEYLGMLDVGPMLLTYSSIGTPDPDQIG